MTEDVDFVPFDGVPIKGREALARFHDPLFKTHLKGTRLEPSSSVRSSPAGRHLVDQATDQGDQLGGQKRFPEDWTGDLSEMVTTGYEEDCRRW